MLSDILDLRAPPEVVEALRHGKRCGAYIRAYCPYCDPHHDHRGKLTLSAGMPRGKPWWGCHRCHAEADIKAQRELDWLRIENFRSTKHASDAERSAAAVDIFNRARPVCTGDAVDLYLRSTRHLVAPSGAWPSDLRLARLKYRVDDKRMIGPWPVMVAGIRNVAGILVAVHRTFLFESSEHGVIKLSDKRVPSEWRVGSAKMSFGPIGGCAIRLGIDSEQIGICEGIESALGLAEATGLTCWSAISAGGMKAVLIPSFVRRVVIGPDIGDGKNIGLSTAIGLRKRIIEDGKRNNRRIDVDIKAPPPGCRDWGGEPSKIKKR